MSLYDISMTIECNIVAEFKGAYTSALSVRAQSAAAAAMNAAGNARI